MSQNIVIFIIYIGTRDLHHQLSYIKMLIKVFILFVHSKHVADMHEWILSFFIYFFFVSLGIQ